MSDYEYMKQEVETAKKTVNATYYINIEGNLYCKDKLFAMLVAKLIHSDSLFYFITHFENYNYIIYPDDIPF